MKDTHSLATPQPLRWAKLFWPLLWTLLLAGALHLLQSGRLGTPPAGPGAPVFDLLLRLIESIAWLLGAWFLIRLADQLLWERWVPRWLGLRTPGLLRQFVAVLLVLLTLAVVFSRTWGLALSAVLATTGVLGIVLGLALRNVLADFVSGMALNIEKPFDLGDFVLLRVRGQRDPLSGTVREINWRSTRLLTPEDNLISVPNSVVALSVVENLSYPSPVSEQEQDLTLDWDVPQDRAERLLSAAATEAWALGATAGDKPPKLRMARMDGGGVGWRVVYLLDPRLRGKAAARHTLLACIHRHLSLVGLRPAALPTAAQAPSTAAQLRQHENAADRGRVLAEVSLLKTMAEAEREQLAAAAQVRTLGAGEDVVVSGEPGDSMFIVAEGVLDVHLEGEDERRHRVHVLGPGSAFGEMALVTGEPRSATVRTLCPVVLYEIHREALLPLLERRPGLVDELGLAVAQYQARDQRTMEQAVAERAAPAPQGMARLLASKLRGWMSSAAR